MKRTKLIELLLFCSGAFIPLAGIGQSPFVYQVLSANSGKFEFSPPFQDYVTLQTYHPANQASSDVHTIFTQSAQDICISGKIAYIAAQDSLIKINLDTYQRQASVADSGLNKLLIVGDRLLASKQYPASVYFVEVLNTDDLSLVTSIAGISGDCGGMAAVGDSVYIAVNGGWMGTEGKIAVVDTRTWSLVREINLGPEAIGTMNIYQFNHKLFTVNKSPYSSPDAGSISVYDLNTHSVENVLLPMNVGTGAGTDGNLLYFGLDYGIGSFNMTTIQVEDTVVVPDPGSAMFKYITSAALDTLNDLIYMNVGDFATPGTCIVSGFAGDSVTTYATGISTDAVAIDYRGFLGVEDPAETSPLVFVYPNPVTDRITIQLKSQQDIHDIRITDQTGRVVLHNVILQPGAFSPVSLDVNILDSGIYFVSVNTSKGISSGKFIKE